MPGKSYSDHPLRLPRRIVSCSFESVQELAERLNLSKEKITVKPYTRTARKPGVRKEMLAGFPQEVEKYVLPAEEKCSVCGGEMKVTGKKVVRTEVEFQPQTYCQTDHPAGCQMCKLWNRRQPK